MVLTSFMHEITKRGYTGEQKKHLPFTFFVAGSLVNRIES
jgi:hypothetical protein